MTTVGLAGALLAGWAVALSLGRPTPSARSADSRGPQPEAQGTSLLRLAVVLGVVLVSLLVVPGWGGWVLAGVGGVVGWHRSGRLEPVAVRRRRARLGAELPHLVDLVLAVVQAGAPPAGALERVLVELGGPLADDLRPSLARLRLGADPVSVWRSLAEHPQLGRLGVVLQRSAESGAPVVDALGRLADDLRSRTRAEVQARVRQVEVRATVPLGLCLLPAFVLVGVVPLVAGAVQGLVLS